MEPVARGEVVAVSSSSAHGPLKRNRDRITLLAGLGVEGDAHLGDRVQHLSRRRAHPELTNLRQVHLIGVELLERLEADGLTVAPGEMGENVTTRGLDLLGLPRGARLRLGGEAVVEVTGLRNPCRQLDGVARGLMAATLGRDANGTLVRLAGVMGVVVADGAVGLGDPIAAELPTGGFAPLEPV